MADSNMNMTEARMKYLELFAAQASLRPNSEAYHHSRRAMDEIEARYHRDATNNARTRTDDQLISYCKWFQENRHGLDDATRRLREIYYDIYREKLQSEESPGVHSLGHGAGPAVMGLRAGRIYFGRSY